MVRTATCLLCGLALVAPGAATAEVVVVVSSKSAVMSLDKAQVMDIFLRKVTRQVDGSPIVPIDLSERLQERDEFYARVTGKTPAQLKAYWSKIIFTGRGQPPKSVSSAAELKKRLLEDPGAIGYLDASAVDGSLRVVY